MEKKIGFLSLQQAHLTRIKHSHLLSSYEQLFTSEFQSSYFDSIAIFVLTYYLRFLATSHFWLIRLF